MGEVGTQEEPLPHGHSASIVILDGFQVGIACLPVQTILIDDIAA